MNFLNHINEALSNLYFSKLRSTLALLGVMVGTASVVAMVLGGQLATNEALRQFKSLGTDLLALSVNPSAEKMESSSTANSSLTLRQAQDLINTDRNILQLAPYTQLFQQNFYEGKSVNAMSLGVTGSFANILHIKMQQGRFISLFDDYQFYCVIGKDIYNLLKTISPKEPLGQQIQIGKYIFVIVGVAQSWPENNFIYANIDNSILMPLLASTVLSKYATINNIVMRLRPNTDINSIETHLQNGIQEHVKDMHISFRSAKALIEKMRKQNDILTVFLGLIGSVSLIVGGIGVMNIMLVSVIERKREIGIRLAVGAKRYDIGILFLIESVVLSLIGGTVGVLTGILIAYIIASLWHWEFTLFLLPPIVGFLVSVAVGIFFGFYPAYQASRLSPIDALRSE